MNKVFRRWTAIANSFPRTFKIIIVTTFIDRLGGSMLFPFFALYLTDRFDVGLSEVGVLFLIFSITSFIGSFAGGALTDRFGRRRMIIFSLVASSLSTAAMGLVNTLEGFFIIGTISGLFTDVGGPAQQAIIADILPEEKRQEGFGVLRVVGNLAWIIGPTIGGFIANRNFFNLFVIDAIISCIVAALIFRLLPETKPATKVEAHHEKPESIMQTVLGYRVALRDFAFMAFIVASILMLIVYQQAYGALSVFLRDVHGISTQGYGFLMTASAITVVLFQFSVSRWLRGRPPFLMMAIGTLFYMIGFTMFGLVSPYWLFVVCIVIITMGEMIVVPVSQGLAANFAPEDMRGRYMAVFGLSWALPQAVGPGAAGYIMDNFNPNLLWYIGGILCALSAFSFWALHLKLGKRERFVTQVAQAETTD